MKIEGFSKAIKFAFALIAAIASLYTMTRPSANLNGYVSESFFMAPPQYNKNVSSAMKYNGPLGDIYLNNLIGSVNLSFTEKNDLVEKIKPLISAPFVTPFENGLSEYRKFIFISLHNSGDALAKDVYVDFPKDVLVLVEDDKEEMSVESSPLKRLNIKSIKQNGKYRIWAWSKINDFDYKGVVAGNENGIASMKYSEEFYGIESFFARYTREILLVIILMFPFSIVGIYYIVCEKNKSVKKEST